MRKAEPDIAHEACLALLLAGTEQTRHARRGELDRLIEEADWTRLADVLTERRVLPILGERALAYADGRAPDSFRAATREAMRGTESQNASLELLTIQLTDLLRDAGIRSLALKGPMLGRALYTPPGRRSSGDIDMLVNSEELAGAVGVARGMGYMVQPHNRRQDGLPWLHVHMDHREANLPAIELHWRVHWCESRFSRDMLERSREAGELGLRAVPADEFVSLLLFYARDGFVGVRLACDIAAWWDAFGDQLGPAALPETISRYPPLERVLVAAVEVAQETIGLPADLVLADRNPERRVRLAERLANPLALGTTTQHHADAWLIDWLVTPPGGGRECVTRQLQAPTRSEAGREPTTRPTLLSSLDRAARLGRRFAMSLTRVALQRSLRSCRGRPGG